MLDQNGKGGYPCALPDLRNTTFRLSPLSLLLALGSLWIPLIKLRMFLSIACLLGVFIYE